MKRIGAAAIGFSILTALCATTASQAVAASVFKTNLIVNGDAESTAGAANPSAVVKPSGWATTGEFTAVQYGASGGFPDKTDPGPTDRGKNFFAGGNAPLSTATQTIDVSSGSADIDTSTVTYKFSTWIGGYASQDDNTKITVEFLDASGSVLAKAAVGPMLAAARKNATGLFEKDAAGTVPAKTHSVRVTITLTRVTGAYNDGSADDLSLIFSKKA
jgi:hypothetical protein